MKWVSAASLKRRLLPEFSYCFQIPRSTKLESDAETLLSASPLKCFIPCRLSLRAGFAVSMVKCRSRNWAFPRPRQCYFNCSGFCCTQWDWRIVTIGKSPNGNSKRVPPGCYSRMLPLHQFARLFFSENFVSYFSNDDLICHWMVSDEEIVRLLRKVQAVYLSNFLPFMALCGISFNLTSYDTICKKFIYEEP